MEAGVDAAEFGDVGRLAVALGIGLLLGAERERRMAQTERRGTAGIRTFALVALLGGLAQFAGGTALVVAALAIVGAAVVAGYALNLAEDRGLTTEVALLVAFLLGVLAQSETEVASALAVTVAVLLASRSWLHRFVSSVLTDQEVHDALLLAAAAVVILPLVPDRTVGPYDVLNPFAVWRLVVLLMAVSSMGYVATRMVGPRYGLPLAGLAGGFVSSTATVASMGSVARRMPELRRPAVAGAVASTLATFVQLAAVVAATSPSTLREIAGVAALGGIGAAGFAALMAVRVRSTQRTEPAPSRRAFEMRAAITVAALITAVTFGGAAASELAGERGVAVAALLGGFADAHAASIGVASLVAAQQLDPEGAVVPILLAITSNTGSKMAFAWFSGGRAYATPVWLGLVIALALAWAGWVLTT